MIPMFLVLGSCGIKGIKAEAMADPGNAAQWEALGNAHRRRLQSRKAAEAYRMAVAVDPSRVDLQQRVAGKLSREARQMRRAARRHPNDDELWGNLADVLRREGDLIGSREAYFRAYRVDPTDWEWHLGLASVGAGDFMLSVLRPLLDDDDDESLGDFGDLLAATGQEEEACTFWRRAAELDPSDEEWIEHAMACGFEVPDQPLSDTGLSFDVPRTVPPASGGDDLGSLVARVRSDASLLVRLGQAYLRAKDVAKATETLWGAVLVAPTNEEALQSYLIATGKTKREVLETLRNTFPDNDEVVGLLADHYLDLALTDRARELYELAHRLDPDDPEWQAKRGLLLR